MQGLRPCFPAEAVELLTMDANDVAEIAALTQNGEHDFVEFWEFHLIRDREEADHHGAHLT